ncbi:MAG TPA: Lrp/AsnC ligand binding domain-containing protein [Chloroflexota bacterium]
MELKEVLARVPGLEKRFVYYLESLGYIRPTRVPKRRIARRDYGEDDLQRIRDLWQYYQRGYSLQAAQELVARPRHRAYALLEVPAHDGHATLAALRALPEVREACLLYGADVDALAELEVAAESEVYEALSRLVSRRAVVAAPLVLHVARWAERSAAAPRGEEAPPMEAYVLLKTPAKHVEAVLGELQGIPAIAEASVIYGETDIIARVEVASQDDLDALVFHRLHEMPMVESTRTFIVVRELRWRRDELPSATP